MGGERKAGELSGRCCVDVDLDGEEEEEESHSPVHKAHTHTSSRGRRKVSWNITKKTYLVLKTDKLYLLCECLLDKFVFT